MKRKITARVLLALVIVLPQPLLPATITVDGQTADQPGTCDLVEAITNANDDADTNADCTGDGAYGDDTIELTVDVTLDTAISLNGLPGIASTIEIQGNDFIVQRDPGVPDFRIFQVLSGGDLTLRNTTVTGGQVDDFGGGIQNLGALTLDHSTLSGNSAGGFYDGGGLSNGGIATLTNSTVVGNSAGFGGGGISNVLTLLLTNSTVSGNTASIRGGGIYHRSGTLTAVNTTIAGNSSPTGTGGGIESRGGTTTLTNSTLSGNSAVGNGVAIFIYDSTTYAAGTILANSAGGGNCHGSITDNGANLADDDTCGTIPDTLTGLDRTLADNGGPTMTHALLPGSNAIDIAGTPFGPERRSAGGDPCSFTDQRGAGREGDCDSGAFEFLTCPDLVLSGETIAGTETRTNCKKIIVEGPDFTVTGTGDLTLRAGTSFEIGNGTSVESGGALTLVRDGDLQIGNTVFATSTSYKGDLGGLLGADANCNERAATAGLRGSFKAWLSDSTCGPADGCRSFTQSNAPYVRVDGVRIADDWTDLTDGTLQANIDVDEFGQPTGVTIVWTSTSADGSIFPPNFCTDWSSMAGSARVGCSNTTNSSWSDCGFDAQCSTLGPRLYCFEQ